jgi:hypothetical protein
MEIPPSWPRCPDAAAFFARQMQTFAVANPLIEQMAARFLREAGVSILNLVDHWRLPASETLINELAACGLIQTDVDGEPVWEHPQARFPRIRLAAPDTSPRLALAAEDAEHFLRIHGLTPSMRTGRFGDDYQEAIIPLLIGELGVVCRIGTRSFAPASPEETEKAHGISHALPTRRRDGSAKYVTACLYGGMESIVAEHGQGRATDVFFAAERAYYMTRNAAARWQYEQQQKLGIGWANHDHHTYRSSREGFRALMLFFLLLGFEMRERFYAGAEAGWGAQILEHPVSRVVIFADVDMAPDELDIDFAHTDLPPRQQLGTIGLWCALHGSSIAQAGMHHLEAEFDYAQVQRNLEAAGYGIMAPFTDMPMLKQAFTQPEVWTVAPERLQPLLDAGSITPEQADKFRSQGAPGSHLEILQRWDGFKGFNKTGVSNIIRATDARAL